MSLYRQPDGTLLNSDDQVAKLTRELSEAKAMLRITSEMMRHTDSCYESTTGCICGVAETWKAANKIVARAHMAPHQKERDNGKLILECCEVVGGAVLSIALLESCLEAGAKIVKQDGQWCLFADDGNGIKCRNTLSELLTDLPPLNNADVDLPPRSGSNSKQDASGG